MKLKKALCFLLIFLLAGCATAQLESSAPERGMVSIPTELKRFAAEFDANGTAVEDMYAYAVSIKPELSIPQIKVYPEEGISTLRHVTENDIYFDHYLEERKPEEIWICVYHIETGNTEFILNAAQVADFLQQGAENDTAISSEPDLNFAGAYGDDIFVTFRGSINAGSKRFLCRYNAYTKKLALIHDFPDEQATWEFLDTPPAVLDEVLYFNEFVPIGENIVTPWLWSYHLATGEKTKLSDNAYAPFIYENKIATVKADGKKASYTWLEGTTIFETSASRVVFAKTVAQKILAANVRITVENAMLIDPQAKIMSIPQTDTPADTGMGQGIGYAMLPLGEIKPIIITTSIASSVILESPVTDGRFVGWFQQKSKPQMMPIWLFDTVKQQLIVVGTITGQYGGFITMFSENAIYFDVFTENADGTRQSYFYIVQKPD